MAFLIVIILGLLFTLAFDQDRSEDQSMVDRYLDFGLVWYGIGGRSQAADPAASNPFYDPAKPTIIFIHGWMPDQAGEPPTFLVDFVDDEGQNAFALDVAKPWIDAGWNIGIFYWHPFSDEDLVWVAEDKIWTPNQEAGMRYRDAAGNYHTQGMPSVSVSDLFLDVYLEAMQDFNGPEIRLAGHSLGNQLAVKLSSELVTGAQAGIIPENLIPSRIALLDPFWSPFPKTYLDGQETGEFVHQIIEQTILPKDILVEWYHSSWLTESTMVREGVPNLKTQVLYAELDPRYCGVLDPICKHDGAWHIYFLSFGTLPPPECIPDESSISCAPTGKPGPMASTPNTQVAEMMKSPYYWVQDVAPDGVDGRYTPLIDDDWFHRLPEEPGME